MNEEDQIRRLLLPIVVDSLGIYPKEFHNSDGTIKKRTSFEDGWNACNMEITEREIKIHSWYKSLSIKAKSGLKFLINDNLIMMNFIKDKVEMSLLCNDVFAYAYADAELIDEQDLEKIYNIYNYHYFDFIGYISIKRKMLPLKEYQTEELITFIRNHTTEKDQAWLIQK